VVWLDVPVAVMSLKNFALLQCSRLRQRIKLRMLQKGRFRRKHSKPLKPVHPATLTRCPTFGQRVFLCRPYTCPPHKSPASPPLQRTQRQPARVCAIEITIRRDCGAAIVWCRRANLAGLHHLPDSSLRCEQGNRAPGILRHPETPTQDEVKAVGHQSKCSGLRKRGIRSAFSVLIRP